MNACQLLFLLEGKQFENPPFQLSKATWAHAVNQGRRTRHPKKKKRQERKRKFTQISPQFSAAALDPEGYTHTQASSAPKVYMQHMWASTQGFRHLWGQADSHPLYGVPALANVWERSRLLVLAELTVMWTQRDRKQRNTTAFTPALPV